ncbi:hypothetical protein SAMN04489712_12197 [Thermomonospora echinospora]|uniref:Uncharacterized protein n=1 Tax=Thermomonospora echinospora TaxID=1992 RepID=A0A1H6DT48_9ACTN|nr:hypothetical protein [Thermomonospora echinospora]SEG88204.1 hypothetical protein SAMN04489712_12197 [Thermomonospora echinospora]
MRAARRHAPGDPVTAEETPGPPASFADGVMHPRVHAAHPPGEAPPVGRRAVGKVLLEVAHGL